MVGLCRNSHTSLTYHRWEIQRAVKAYAENPSKDFSKTTGNIQDLDHRLDQAHERLLSYGTPEVPCSTSSSESYLLFSVLCLYHLCACTLTSTMVPLFSNIPSNPLVSKKMSRICAEDAIRHASELLELAAKFVVNQADAARLPSTIGFAMFVASTIHFRTLGAQNKLRSHGLDKIHPAIVMVQELKSYWRPLSGPVSIKSATMFT